MSDQAGPANTPMDAVVQRAAAKLEMPLGDEVTA
jgi:hypothetical protein